MASEVIGSAVIFAFLLLSLSVLYPAVSNFIFETTEAEKNLQDRILNTKNMEVDIKNINATGDLNITSKNTGTKSIDVEDIDVFLDGELKEPNSVEVENDPSREIVQPLDSFEIIYYSQSNVDRVKIVVNNGVSDVKSN